MRSPTCLFPFRAMKLPTAATLYILHRDSSFFVLLSLSPRREKEKETWWTTFCLYFCHARVLQCLGLLLFCFSPPSSFSPWATWKLTAHVPRSRAGNKKIEKSKWKLPKQELRPFSPMQTELYTPAAACTTPFSRANWTPLPSIFKMNIIIIIDKRFLKNVSAIRESLFYIEGDQNTDRFNR